jgi:AAA family ATP:ADP antiporter
VNSEIPQGSARSGAAHRFLSRFVDIEPNEVHAVIIAGLYFFFTLSSYFMLRPIRDAMAVAAGISSLPWMFAGTLLAMLLAIPIYSALVVRFPVKRFIGFTYQFFAVNLALFFIAHRVGVTEVWLGRVFFVWTSVFNMFVVTIFWSFMADSFRSGQAKRLFGFIGVGGTLGSIGGSFITAVLARSVGPVNLLLVSAAFLEIAVLLVMIFPAASVSQTSGSGIAESVGAVPDEQKQAIGGSAWAGITHVLRSPYLAGIAGFIVLYTLGSTVLYFEQTVIIGRYFDNVADSTQILARMELATQVLVVVFQTFLTGRVIRWIGLTATLALMPVISLAGFAAIGASELIGLPVLAIFIAFSIARRSTNFAFTNPSMETLYTVVTREDKYKAKSVIDTFIYRAGDQLGAWGYAGLGLLGLGLTAIAWVAVPLSALFAMLAVWLGRREGEMSRRVAEEETRMPSAELEAVAST